MFGLVPAKREIKVADIKQHLVDEFTHTKQLEAQIWDLENKIEEYKKVSLKYDATLVTLDEYKNRIGRRDNDVETLKSKLQYKDKEIKSISDELNTYKILATKHDREKQNMKKASTEEFRKELLNKISGFKGTLSKKAVIEMINE